MPDIPMNRIFPSARSAWSSATVPSRSICSRLGDMCTWTRSSRSVPSRRRLRSTPARTLAALQSCGYGGVAPGGGSPSRHPHFEARKYSSRRWPR